MARTAEKDKQQAQSAGIAHVLLVTHCTPYYVQYDLVKCGAFYEVLYAHPLILFNNNCTYIPE